MVKADDLMMTFMQSVSIFSRLDALLGGEIKSTWSRLKWLRIESKVLKLVQQLDTQKASIMLLLSILQWYGSPNIFHVVILRRG